MVNPVNVAVVVATRVHAPAVPARCSYPAAPATALQESATLASPGAAVRPAGIAKCVDVAAGVADTVAAAAVRCACAPRTSNA